MGSIRKRLRDYRGKSTRMKYTYGSMCSKHSVCRGLVLFESFHGRDISDSPLYLLRSLLRMEDAGRYEIWFATNGDPAHREFLRRQGLDRAGVRLADIYSDDYARLLATAEYLVNNSSFPSWFIRREGQHYLQTWHGTPLKTLGKRMRMGMESMHNVQHNFLQADLLSFPNEFTRDAMMEDYNLQDLYTGRVVLCGYPRNSIFADREAGQRLRRELGTEGLRTLAYMPTWRGQNNYEIETEAYRRQVNEYLARIDGTLGEDQRLYVNFHPIVADSITLDSYRHIEAFPAGIDKYEFLNSCDALITDYSSVFFDYSITGKPVLLFMYDYEEYMKDRGMYLDVRELPFGQYYDIEALCGALQSRAYKKEEAGGDAAYRERFLAYDSAGNSDRLAALFFRGEAADLPVEDCSGNARRHWNLIHGETVSTPEALDEVMASADGEKDLLVLAKRSFGPELSSYLYDHYLEGVNFVFTVRSVPRTIREDIAQKWNGKIRREIHRRDLRRCFGSIPIDSERKAGGREAAGTVTGIRTSGSRIEIRAQLRRGLDASKLRRIVLDYRSDVETVTYDFTYSVQGRELTCTMDFAGRALPGIYWDLLVETGDGRALRLDLDARMKERLRKRVLQCGLGDFLIFPHITIQGQLAFTHREKTPYDGWGTRLKEMAAITILKLNRRRLKKRKIWLVFEKFCSMAQDNGYYFFRYCMEELPEEEKKDIYYVMKPEAEDWAKVAGYGRHVLKFMSIRHLVYAMAAEVFVGSDSKKHLYLWRPKPNLVSFRLRKKKILFLQHGVTALKRVDGIFGRHGSSPMTHFTTTSEYEQRIIVDNFGYSPEDAPVLGFTRWDVLEDTSKEEDRMILVMPTWRSWLEERTAEEFRQSDYYRQYMELFTDPKLAELLENYDARMIFYIHPKFRDYLGEFVIRNERIRMIPFGSTPLNAIMRDCRMLITDYSSVCWDVYYMGKPVLFYQFDYEMYQQVHGSYMDMETELFGPRYMDSGALLAGLEEKLASGFAEDEEAAAKRGRYFTYIDNENCRRTY